MSSPRLFRSFLALLLVLVALPAFAGIREAHDSILDSRAHKVLSTIADNLGTEDTVLPQGHAVAVLSLSGCNFNLMLVGPVSGDARAYARAIDAWRARQGFEGDVQWSQEDDCAAARYSYAPGHVGMSHATTTVGLPVLRDALLAVEPQTQFVVADAVWSKVDFGFPPDATTAQGTRYWNLTLPRADLRPVTGSIVVAPWIPWMLVAWFLIPIVGILGSFVFGVLIAKNVRLPLARRRRLYGKAVLGGSYGALAVHGVLFVATVPTRLFDPLAQLWFGQRFVALALPIVPAFAIVPMLALPLMNRVEKRLMGPSDEERLRQEVILEPSRPLTKPKNGHILKLFVPLMVVGFGLNIYKDFALRASPLREEVIFASFLLMVLPLFGVVFTVKRPKYLVDPETLERLDATLRERVATLAARLDMDAPPSRVLTEAIYGRFGAVIDKKGIGVTVGALEELASAEIDFLVAHELAHAKLGHLVARRRFMVATMSIALVPMLLFLLGRSVIFANPAFVFTPMLLPIAFMVPVGMLNRRAMRRQEFEADALALRVTHDTEAAASALRKATLNSAQPGIHDMDMASHPTVGARLAAMGA